MALEPPCPAAQNTLRVVLQGDLDAAERARFERHLAECPTCRRATVDRLTGSPPDTDRGRGADGEASAPREGELARGTRVGRHMVTGVIGAGGMGTVYAAYDTLLDRRIALKFLSLDRQVESATTATTRLLAEASAMARLAHPNVVTVHDVDTFEGRPYLAMEYVKGRNLREWRRHKPRSVRQILDVLAGVARGLGAAHAAGIVHRDVKPENVLVTGQRALVTDFGISVRDSSAGGRAGTPAYMAPEHMRDEPPTTASDVYSFCVTCHEMLYEEHPFEVTPASDGGPPTRVRRPAPTRPRVPRRVQRLLEAGLADDPAARPSSMPAMAEALLDDPVRRAWRWGAGVTAAAVAAFAFWGGARLEARPERRCAAGAADIEVDWNGGRRQALAGRYRAAGLGASWQAAEGRFGAFASGWQQQLGAVCREAFADRRISGELFDLRMECLASQRATFAALLTSAGAATPAQLSRLAATPLPVTSECAFTERAASKPLPDDPATRKRVTEVNGTVATARARLELGDFPAARKLATEAVGAARQIGYEPLLARALARLAQIELRGVKQASAGPPPPGAATGPDRAVKLLEESLAVAELGRADGDRAQAAIELALAHRDAFRTADAERWAQLAASITGRIGDPPLLRASLEHTRGWIQYDRGDWKLAGDHFDRALELRRQALGPRAVEVLSSKTTRCHVMNGRDKRIACYREADALATSVLGPQHPEVARLRSNMANVLKGDARTRPEAMKLAEQAVKIGEGAFEPDHDAVLFAMLILADSLKDQGKMAEARPYYEEGLRRTKTPTGRRSDINEAFGIYWVVAGDYQSAIRHHRAAIADRMAIYGPADFRTIDSRHSLSDALRRAGKREEALAELEQAIADCDRAARKPRTYVGLFELKAYTESQMGRDADAYATLQRGLEALKTVQTSDMMRFYFLRSLGIVERKLGKLGESADHLDQAMTLVPLEADPWQHADVAFDRALTAEKQGRPQRSRLCSAAQQALTGFQRPAGGDRSKEIAETRKLLARHRCPTG